eukprot:6312453-Pyramimonas_sp.AAC.1
MFRKIWTPDHASVCRVSHAMCTKHDDIDAALVQAANFATGLSTELGALLHQVGMNESMSELVLAGTGLLWYSIALRSHTHGLFTQWF